MFNTNAKSNIKLADDNVTSATGILRISWQDDVCVVDIHDESKSFNSLTRELLADLDRAVENILAQPRCVGLVVTSSKPSGFTAGADIGIFETIHTAQDGETAALYLHKLFDRFAHATVPTVAAVHGTCLGGGLEMALACHMRVATTHSSTQLGLPEIQLGLIPGGGGTQRLPRLIGIAPALEMILTAKKVDGKKALKIGLVNDCVPENQLVARAVRLCKENKNSYKKKGVGGPLGFLSRLKMAEIEKQLADLDVTKFAMESNILGRSVIKKKSLEQVQKNTKGNYPAPYKAVESVMRGMEMSLESGLALEAKLFGELLVTPESRSLVHIFRIMTAAKKNPFDPASVAWAKLHVMEPLKQGKTTVGILGAGLMGSGIATVLADKGVRSTLVDREPQGVERGLKATTQYFDERLRKRRIKRFERDGALGRVMPALSYDGLKTTPIVIEAVYEDLSIKHDVLKKCEAALANEDFIFATNTSSLPIARIAAGARKPENVVGMHFFSPVPKMPLVEIITSQATSPAAASAVFELASKMGKNIVVVKDGPGFYTTRILSFMLMEAVSILCEGASIEDIDRSLEKFGMPVGPITLMDEVGIDVGGHIMKVLQEAFGARMVVPKEMELILGENRKGRKNNFGFYTYLEGKKDKPDKTIYKHLKHGENRKSFDQKEIADRCVLVFMNEAAHCLDEGIIGSPDDGDLGAVFGLGFPPFLGGPFHYANTLGKAEVHRQLLALADKFGKRFAPASYWKS